METIDDWIHELRSSSKLILVEGQRDKKALNDLGITNIETIAQKPLFATVEKIAQHEKDVIILTDLDNEGRKYYSCLKHSLQKHSVKVDRKFREFLFKNTTITQIEGMKKFI